MSNELINFLSTLKITLNEEIYSFVYFDKITGKIEKISCKEEKNNDNECQFIKVKYSSVEDLISGKNRLEDYRVLYNSKIKDFEILQLEKNINIKNINNSLLKVNKCVNNNKEVVDLLIQQNNKNKCWNFYINENINFLKNVNDVMFFSITENNDPNILYRTIVFNVNDLVDNFISIPYIYDSEKNTSVFTNKVLDTYIHEVIND
jgi:hypothetical protein